MKRFDFLRLLKKNDCILIREGNKHSVFYNSKTEKTSTVPRHTEINDFLFKKICRDLGIEL